MKKLHLLVIGIVSMSAINAQDLSDALRFSQSEIQGTARFRALSGAFGALGGDMSAVSINPAGSAVFNQSHVAFSFTNSNTTNDTQYFNAIGNSNASNFDVNQGGGVFVFASNTNNASPWKKFTFAITYDKNANHNDNWFFRNGINNNNQSIDLYFLNYANGVELGTISLLENELIEDAYQDIGEVFGFVHQQAFLGYQAFIIEPDVDTDDNTTYYSNLVDGNFNHSYSYFATGNNGKITFNFATQYEDNLYLGLNLNSHFIDYQKSTSLVETNENSTLNYIRFDNTLSTTGNGFSFQLGGIMKLSPEFRIGLTYDSPIWYSIDEETTQFIDSNLASNDIGFISDIINIYPRYRLQTPSKVTGSLAYIFAKQGLLSFDYSRKDYSKTRFNPESDLDFADLNTVINDVFTTASTYRIGGEYKHKQWRFRGGYRFEESPYKNETTVGDLNGFSLGLGFNFGNTNLDLSYDKSNQSFETPLYNTGLTDAASIDRTNSNLTLSLSFNI